MPRVPRQWVRPQQHYTTIKKQLLQHAKTGPKTGTEANPQLTAIVGPTGMGKTALVAALAQDAQIQQAFCDGILWARTGDEASFLADLYQWIISFGDPEYQPTSLVAAIEQVRFLAQGKRLLLILDDVVSAAQLTYFQDLPDCHLLYTTAQTSLIAPHYAMAVGLTAQEAQQLFMALGLDADVAQSDPALQRLAQTVNYNPQALGWLAQLMGRGFTPSEIEQVLPAEIPQLNLSTRDTEPQVEPPCRSVAPHCAGLLSYLLKQLPTRDCERFMALGLLAPHAQLTPQLAAKLWQIDVASAAATLATLERYSLLEEAAVHSATAQSFQVSTLAHDLACRWLKQPAMIALSAPGVSPVPWAMRHRQFLEAYTKPERPNGDLAIDGASLDEYMQCYLGWHLEQAGESESLHQLLVEPDHNQMTWFTHCTQRGKPYVFSQDLERVWRLAAGRLTTAPKEAIAQLCGYALLSSSLQHRGQGLPVSLLIALVKTQQWTALQGLTQVLHLPNQRDQAKALQALAPHCAGELFQLVLAIVQQMPDQDYRAIALSGLASALPKPYVGEALTLAAALETESAQAIAFSGLALKVPTAKLPDLLERCRQFQDSEARAELLLQLVQRLPSLLPEVLATIRQITPQTAAVERLLQLLPDFPTLWPEVLFTVQQIESESQRAILLAGLASCSPPKLRLQLLATIQQIQQDTYRAMALGSLMSTMTDPDPNILKVVRTFKNKADQARLLCHWVAHRPIRSEALQTIRQVTDRTERAALLCQLAPAYPEILPEVMAAIDGVLDRPYRLELLSSLVAKYPEILPRILTLIALLPEAAQRAEALSQLTPQFPDLIAETVQTLKAVTDPTQHRKILGNLARYAPASQLQVLLEQTYTLQDRPIMQRLMTALATYVPPIEMPPIEAVPAALTPPAASHSANGWNLDGTEASLDLLAAVRGMAAGSSRVRAYSGLIRQIPPQQFTPALLSEVLQELAKGDRPSLLQDLEHLCAAFYHIGGTPLLRSVMSSVQRVTQQWP